MCCRTRAPLVSRGFLSNSARLSEIPRHVLRVECLRCQRIVEIQMADAIRLYGPHAIYKDVGQKLLDSRCEHRTGRLEEDGCWPNWTC